MKRFRYTAVVTLARGALSRRQGPTPRSWPAALTTPRSEAPALGWEFDRNRERPGPGQTPWPATHCGATRGKIISERERSILKPMAHGAARSADVSSKSRCSRDQKQTCPDDDGADGSRDALTSRCETFDRDRCRHGSHRAKVHDPDNQKDGHQTGAAGAAVETEVQAVSPGRAGAGRQSNGRAPGPPGSRQGDVLS